MNRLLAGIASAAVAVLLTFAGTPSAALIGGVDSPDTPVANATVNVNGASGTLVAPDLVVTNGHVTGVPIPPARPAFSRTNAHDVALWHSIPAANPVTVSIGAPARVLLTRSNPFTSPRTRWEIHDADGGSLLDGDLIGLKTHGYFAFVNGGRRGGDLRIDAIRNRFAEWQTLTLEKVSGSEGDRIRGGDRIALKARDGSYLAAARRNGPVVADAAVRAARHEFTILTFGGRGAMSNDVINDGGTVAVGSADSGAGFMQAPYRLEGEAIATPGYDDIALVRLAEPVPESLAVPVPMKLRLDAGDAPTIEEFYRRASLRVAGYGLVAGRAPASWRQEAAAGNAVRETPGRDGLSSRYSARSAGRVDTQPGDSGGSWFVRSPRGLRLVGITQQTGNKFLTPMYRGGMDSDSNSKPDLHAWFSMFMEDDDCVAAAAERGLSREIALRIGARTVCRFGDAGAPFAVAYADAGRSSDGADCRTFDAAGLSLRRPDSPEGAGTDMTTWRLTAGSRQLMGIEGTWQQAYTRAAYLLSFLQRRGMNTICYSNRPDPSLTYFRD